MRRAWVNFFIGMVAGIFFCVSFFEIIHRTIEIQEVSGWHTCAIIEDKLNHAWLPDIVYNLKITYKFFAWPSKILYVALSQHHQLGVRTERGEWIVSPIK